MKYLLAKASIQNIENRLSKVQRVFLFLDYDGTLTSIRKAPDLALLSSSVREVLRKLSSLSGVILTIISGRALNEIQKQVNLDGLNYVGNHGLEMKAGFYQDEIPQSNKIRKRMVSFSREIEKRTREIPGILIENKGLTLSIHYRLAKRNCLGKLKEIASSILSPFAKDYNLRGGKKVLEIVPAARRDKGWAVKRISHLFKSKLKSDALYFYFGDDLTDEDGFGQTNLNKGYSVLVGGNKTCSKAHYYLQSPKEVRLFLSWLRKTLVRKQRRNCEHLN